MSNLVLPAEFTLESISSCFSSVFTRLEILTNKSREIESVSMSKPSLAEVLNAFVEKPRTDMAVDLFVVDGLLKGITQKVLTRLQALEDNLSILASTNENLLIKLGQATRAMKKKTDDLNEKFEKLVNYTKEHFLKAFLEKKKKKVFKTWKSETKKQKKLTRMLRKSLIQIHRTKLKTGFVRWKALV